MFKEKGQGRLLTATCVAIIALFSLARSQPAPAQVRADWKEKWEKVLSDAKKEGKVAVWGHPGELIRNAVTVEFRKAFPDISVEFSAARGGEHGAKITAERDGGVYSVDVVVSGTTTALTYFKPIRALDPVEPVLILPEVTDLKNWRDNKLDFADVEGKLNLAFAEKVKNPLIYNPNLVKEGEIDELYELLNPKWKGKIIINDPLPSGAGNVTFRWIWQVLGPEKATEYYRRIRAQAAAVDRDERRQLESVSQGKYAINFGSSDRLVAQFLKRGLKFRVLEQFQDHIGFTTAGANSILLINKRPHPNAAAVFVNWLLGKAGQAAWTKATDYPSRRLDAPTDHLPSYVVPKAGRKYWANHYEKDVRRSPEEEKILKELFGR